MDKRKGIILAIVLFLIIGLGTFVFAGGSDEGSGDGTITPQPDGGDNNDPINPSDPDTEDDGNITEGEDKEDTTRPAGGNDDTDGDELVTDGEGEKNPTTPAVDYKTLLSQLANMVESATSKEDLAEAEQFRKDNNITEENVATLNDDAANETYGEIIGILTDDASPEVTPDDLNGSFTNKERVAVEITDTTDVSYILTINGEEVADADLANLTEEGNYELTVTDSAFNSTTITFTVDRTNPVLLVNDVEVKDGETIYVNEAATLTVDESNLDSVSSNNIDITKAFVNNGSWTAQKDGTYNIVVTDKAGNETSYTIVRDTVKIEVDHLYVLNNSHNDFTVSDDVRYKVIGNGQKLYFEYVLKEEFSSTPVLTIGGQEFEMDCKTASWNDSLYKCDANITITEDMELKNGEIIPFTITGVKDIAQNETIVTEKNVTVTEKYGQVIYDKAAPVYEALGILNVTHLRLNNDGANESLNVANVGDQVRVLIRFDEELTTLPTLVIGGTSVQMTLMKSSAEYTYSADITLTADMFDEDCLIDFQISGYADAAGNIGDVLNASHIKGYADYAGVKFDTTKPLMTINGESNITLKAGDTYDELGVTVEDAVDGTKVLDPVRINYSIDGEFQGTVPAVDTTKPGTYKVVYEYTDAAGNVGVDADRQDHDFIIRTVTVEKIETYFEFTEPDSNVYDGNEKEFEMVLKDQFGNILDKETINIAVKDENNELADLSDAGDYTIAAHYAGSDMYEAAYIWLEYTIEQAETYFEFTEPDSNIYDGNEKEYGVVLKDQYGNILDKETINVAIKDENGEIAELIDAGTYSVAAHYSGSKNYKATYKWVEYTIEQAATTFELVYPESNVYSGTEKTIGFVLKDQHGNVLNETVNTAIRTEDGVDTTLVDAGTYIITAHYAGSDNYKATYLYEEYVIEQAATEIILTYPDSLVADGTPKVFKAELWDITNDKLVKELTPVYEDANGNRGDAINAGKYNVIVHSGYMNNYKASYITEGFEILPEGTTSLVNGVAYSTLLDALRAASLEEPVVLVDDLNVDGAIGISKDVTIDLNGNDLTLDNSFLRVYNGGTLNITGEGTVYSSYKNYAAIDMVGSSSASDTEFATLYIGEDVTVKGNSGIFVFQATDTSVGYGVNIVIDGTIEAVDIDDTPASFGVYVQGMVKNYENMPTITLSETAEIKSDAYGIYAAGYAVWNVNGAYIEGEDAAIGIKSGILNVTGGTLKATGPNNMPTENFGNGINSSGAALQIESNKGYAGEMEINISGGEFISEHAVPIYEYDSTNDATMVKSFSITGGTFTSNEYGSNLSFSPNFNLAHTDFIKGGVFNKNTSEVIDNLAEGYIFEEQADGTYKVVQG